MKTITVDGKELWGLAPNTVIPSRGIENRIRRFAEEQGIEYLDIPDMLRQTDERESRPLYFDRDGHWRALAHRYIADWLEAALVPEPGKEALSGPSH